MRRVTSATTTLPHSCHAVLIQPGETIWTGDGRKLRVIDVVPFEEEAASPFVGMLRVEPG